MDPGCDRALDLQVICHVNKWTKYPPKCNLFMDGVFAHGAYGVRMRTPYTPYVRCYGRTDHSLVDSIVSEPDELPPDPIPSGVVRAEEEGL